MKLKHLLIIAGLLLVITLLLQKCHAIEYLVYIGANQYDGEGKIILATNQIVDIREDGHNWGSGEKNSLIFQIQKKPEIKRAIAKERSAYISKNITAISAQIEE